MRDIISSAWNKVTRRSQNETHKKDDSIVTDNLPLVVVTQPEPSANISTKELLKNYFDFIFAPENRLRIAAASLLTMAMTVFSVLAPYYLGLIIVSLAQNKPEDSHIDSAISIELDKIFKLVFLYARSFALR